MNPTEQYIRQAALSRGMSPDITARLAAREGLNGFDPSRPDHGGDGGSSFGPFQLHYGGINPAMPHAGLGDEFTRQTGLDAHDPATWQKQVDFSLDYAKNHGWGSWMGAKAAGIGPWDGINMASGNVAAQQPSPPQAPGTPAPPLGQATNIGSMAPHPMQPPAQITSTAPVQQPNTVSAISDFKNGDTKAGIGNVFGALSAAGNALESQQMAPLQPAQIQGPTAQQVQALPAFLASLGRRRSNQI